MTTLAPANKPIIIGKISGVFGVHGWVKIFSFTEPRDNILKYDPWLLKVNKDWQSASVVKGRNQGKTIVAQLKGVDDRDMAHSLIGNEIAIDPSLLEELGENDFYWRDLEGLTVVDQHGDSLGIISSMLSTGANDVMVVKLASEIAKSRKEKELLIPYLFDEVVKKIDLKQGVIEVDWELDFD